MADPGREGGRGGIENKLCKVKEVSTHIPTYHSNVTTDMLVLRSSTYKGGLDTLDDPECNFRDHIYYYFVPDWPDMDGTRACG